MSLYDCLPEACETLCDEASQIRDRIQYVKVVDVMTMLHEQMGGLSEDLLSERRIGASAVRTAGTWMIAALDRYGRIPVPSREEMRRLAVERAPSYIRTGVPIDHSSVIDRLVLEMVSGWAAYTCASPVTWGMVKRPLVSCIHGGSALLLAACLDRDSANRSVVSF